MKRTLRNQSIGNIDDWQRTNRGFRFSAIGFSGSVTCFSNRCFRIRIEPECNVCPEHSYAVIAEPDAEPIDCVEQDGNLILQTTSASLEVSVAPFRVTLKDENGKVLSSDDPAFGTSCIGNEVCTYRSLQPGERFLGLGEKVGPVDRKGHAYTNYNTDKFAYSVEEDPLYLSTPFFIGVHDVGTYGLFYDNTFRSRFNFGASTERFSWFSSTNGAMDYYLIAGGGVDEIIKEYSSLTGYMPMPPRWALGYQQCRYSYYPDHEVTALAQTFRDKEIPADVIYLDIHYMDRYKAFTFDKERFPDPGAMHEGLAKHGFRTVAIVDPGIKVEPGYGTYDRGVAGDVFVQLPDGERYQGEVWPSWSHFPDFTKSEARAWWANEIEFYSKHGVAGIWNDMNEPAAWGQCLPELIEFDNEGRPTSHAEVRNVYGMQMARATRDGLVRERNKERPFVLTRAGYSGVQRYSAVWTGDNVSSDDHLMLSCRMLCSMGLTGIPFAGNDIGGFAGEASPALFARWMSIGVFQPMCRAHTQVNTRDAEPWSFGEEVEQIARNYISLRYRLMPYIYTAFKVASETAMPIMRSMAIDHSHEASVYDTRFENQYYFGPHLLVCPARSTQEAIEVYLPQGEWYDLYSDERFTGGTTYLVHCPLYKIPVFVRAGAVIPWMSQTQHTDETHDGVLRLHIYPGAESEGGLYEDDGISMAGDSLWRNWILTEKGLTIEASTGAFTSEYDTLEIVLHAEAINPLVIDGRVQSLEKSKWRCLRPITGIDTFFADKGSDLGCEVYITRVALGREALNISW